jgi:uncharacterized phage protein (TIGR02218 family)
MSYAAREISRFGGEPVECYKFTQGNNTWLYTSADREIVLPTVGTFTPTVITRDELDFSQEDTGETIDFTVPRSNPVAALFIGQLPSTPIGVTVYRAHRGDENSPIVIFSGKIIRCRFEESQAILAGASLMSILSRVVPPLAMQTPCNHVLYSAGCGINPTISRDAITVESVSGNDVVSPDFALRADGWFTGGRLEGANGETRFIVDHVGDTITLISSLSGLEAGDTPWAYWGCDHLEATCTSKFTNLDNYLGWSRIPSQNPFSGRID